MLTPSLLPSGGEMGVTMITPHPIHKKRRVEAMVTPSLLPSGGEMGVTMATLLPLPRREAIHFTRREG